MALKEAFLLTYDGLRRYQGTWHLEKRLLFPANVLLESEDEEILKEELNHHAMLMSGHRSVSKMNLKEEQFLRILCGKQRHLKMSRGVICNGITEVTEGPLKGMESQICKIDRHKRLARLRMPESRNISYIPAGLEIVEKSVCLEENMGSV